MEVTQSEPLKRRGRPPLSSEQLAEYTPIQFHKVWYRLFKRSNTQLIRSRNNDQDFSIYEEDVVLWKQNMLCSWTRRKWCICTEKWLTEIMWKPLRVVQDHREVVWFLHIYGFGGQFAKFVRVGWKILANTRAFNIGPCVLFNQNFFIPPW